MNIAAWQGPPTDILGHPAPIQQFVARTDHAVVALRHVVVFPEGCSLSLHVAVRRGSLDDSVWKGVLVSDARGGPHPRPTDADLNFGIRFPDGSKAMTIDNVFRGLATPTDRPEPPVLIETGSESTSNDRFYQSDRQLWLWPLPPPGPLEFVIEWRKMGIDATPTTLDGEAIAHAAEQALPYWP